LLCSQIGWSAMVVPAPREDEESSDEHAALVSNRRVGAAYTTMDSVEAHEEQQPQGRSQDGDALEYGAAGDDAALLSQFHEDAIKQVCILSIPSA
jgi:hypothetical protein